MSCRYGAIINFTYLVLNHFLCLVRCVDLSRHFQLQCTEAFETIYLNPMISTLNNDSRWKLNMFLFESVIILP